jgi:hypothetical protein
MPPMLRRSAHLYDAIYASIRDYPREAAIGWSRFLDSGERVAPV